MKTKSNLSIFMIMFGFTFFSGSMLVGKQLSEELSGASFIASIIMGGVILGTFGGILAYIGCKKKCTLRDLTRNTFGLKGSWLPSILVGITQVGWYGVSISMFAIPVSRIIAPNNKAILALCIFLFGGIMTLSTYMGLSSITKLSYIAVPVIFLFGVGIIIYGFGQNATDVVLAFGPNGDIGWIYGTELVVGTYISGSITTPNFTKYGRQPWIVAAIVFSAFLVGNGLMIVFGALSNIIVGGSDIFDLFTYYHCRFLGIVVLGLNIWSSCDNGLYSASLELENIICIPHKKIIAIAGIGSTLFSLILYHNFTSFLVAMNRTLPPIGMILILDSFFNRKSENSQKVRTTNILAIVIGAIFGLLVNGGIPAINGLLISTIIFFGAKYLPNAPKRKNSCYDESEKENTKSKSG